MDGEAIGRPRGIDTRETDSSWSSPAVGSIRTALLIYTVTVNSCTAAHSPLPHYKVSTTASMRASVERKRSVTTLTSAACRLVAWWLLLRVGCMPLALGFNALLSRSVAPRPRLGTGHLARRPLSRMDVQLHVNRNTAACASVGGLIDPRREIFCNAEMTGSGIEAVGFDMDYTLAKYNTKFDELAFEGANAKLSKLGYPDDALQFNYE
jgi:hypothetical protein